VDVPPGAPVEFQVLRDNDWNQRSSVGVWNGIAEAGEKTMACSFWIMEHNN